MTTDRREFLRRAAAVGGGIVVSGSPVHAAEGMSRAAGSVQERSRTAPMRILILGGTSFIGPHQVRYALDRGHEITLFNRGRTNTHLFPEVERLVG
ncbi:MAG: twin-arginine translocation signal domain-containing protein, partial [Gemmatimonadetes bacterium]|nr:twin-arginine translocation signal domain-containing protein [Gemmatimonadota bacterium]